MPGRIYKTVLLALLLLSPVFLSAQAALVNINTASSEELQTLNGIGPSKAQAIIDYRNGPNGPFETIEEIQNVSGIGDVTYNNIKDFITVGASAAPAPVTTVPVQNASSVHYGSTPVSNVDKKMDVSVSAGRDRVGTVGSPLEFIAETDFDYTKSSIFSWNFGDGHTGAGNIITHTYDYPGEYVVVLNVSLSNGQAVARVNVTIVDPKLTISSATPERIEIKNDSKYEANLYGRALVSGDRIFIFPQDTILRPGQSISFGSKITGLYPTNPAGASLMTIGDTEQPKIAAKVAEEKSKRISEIYDQMSAIEQELASIQRPIIPPVNPIVQKSEDALVGNPQPIEPQAAAVVKSGWWQTFKRFLFSRHNE